jgi:hypothetical protein
VLLKFPAKASRSQPPEQIAGRLDTKAVKVFLGDSYHRFEKPIVSTFICISSSIRDPFVRAAVERAERDEGCATCVPDKLPRTLDGGAAERIPDRVENLAAMSRDKMAFEYA